MSRAAAPFASARERIDECDRRVSPAASGHSYFAAVRKRQCEVLGIGFERGDVTHGARYDMERVHSMAFFAGGGSARYE